MITQGTHKYYAPSFAENEEVRYQSILGSSALKCLATQRTKMFGNITIPM